MSFKIDKSVPMPGISGITGRPEKYPFSQMEVGDSVFFDGVKVGGKEYVASQMSGRKNGWKFSGRSIDGGLRIWRVA